jgi:hypothetical protein
MMIKMLILIIMRHDGVCSQLHFNICKEIWVILAIEHWYKHVPNLLEVSHEGKVTTLWNQKSANRQHHP